MSSATKLCFGIPQSNALGLTFHFQNDPQVISALIVNSPRNILYNLIAKGQDIFSQIWITNVKNLIFMR